MRLFCACGKTHLWPPSWAIRGLKLWWLQRKWR